MSSKSRLLHVRVAKNLIGSTAEFSIGSTIFSGGFPDASTLRSICIRRRVRNRYPQGRSLCDPLTDRAAFELAAAPNLSPLRVTDVDVIARIQLLYSYSDILSVFMDIGGPAVLLSIGDVGVIPQGGAHPSSGFIGVGRLSRHRLLPSGTIVFGTFMLNGIAVTATSPTFFGYIFDQPTTSLPLPEIFCCTTPSIFGGLPRQGTYFASNITMRTVPEPSTALLFGSAFALLQVVRLRRKSST